MVRHNAYADSITLLQVSAAITELEGVIDAALVMGTELNMALLRDSGLLTQPLDAGLNDLVIAVRAHDAATAETAVEQAERLLAQQRPGRQAGVDRAEEPRSLRSALRQQPDSNVALVSVPGPYAAGAARQALALGLHVFLFSDNVSVEDEVQLKRQGREKGILVMGPDCGTAILNGVALGFANVVRRGRVGLIGASGTGIQEVSCLLDRAGDGISHAIGTGGRDLHEAVGAIGTLQALDMLAADPSTETIVLISKPPSPAVAERVLEAAVLAGKRVIACLLGAAMAPRDGVELATNLYQAARLAASDASRWKGISAEDLPRLRLRDGQRQVRGLFCGGTLRDEADLALGVTEGVIERDLIDFGDDRYTRGRAHPMIDPTLRNQALLEAGADPRVAVLLLDVILGYGAHADPAGALAPTLDEVQRRAAEGGRELAILAHIVGTERDRQSFAQQEAKLRAVGAHVFGSNYHAAVAAGLLLEAAAG
ncbi:MAG: acyl-CoA synthetase FdrA [Chloroflexi bacterium]|nr:acyl-CoA synthetase FdrA [Chloroflexota bacterium]